MNIEFKTFIRKLITKSPVLIYDTLSLPVSWVLAYWVMYNLGRFPFHVFYDSAFAFATFVGVQWFFYYRFSLYRGLWRYCSIADLVRIVKAVGFASLVALSILFLTKTLTTMPRSVVLLYIFNILSLWCGGRLSVRWAYERQHLMKNNKPGQRVLIVGTGPEGEGLVREMMRQASSKYIPIGFVNNDAYKLTQEIHGVKILGGVRSIEQFIKHYRVDLVIIAEPCLRAASLRIIYKKCERLQIPVRILPSLKDIASGAIDINALRDVAIEDLLGREQVSIDWRTIQYFIKSQTILVTGGGGSIGSELCRQIASMAPGKLCILDSCEYNLYAVHNELRTAFPRLEMACLLGSITDARFINKHMLKLKPSIVFHAAAYKHVPILEQHVAVAIKNNIIGTQVLAEAAVEAHVAKFVLISTDKAINPTNIMGATKRLSEIFCQNLNALTETQFITVRFGNVLGSSGSVLPLFKNQLREGQALTVTHPEISRYFMTIPEACQLIMQASVIGEGGEIFVLDMGKPVKIKYLAEQLIKLSGKEPGIDVDIRYTGLRPGEKLFEELFHDKEKIVKTSHDKILKASHRVVDWQTLYFDMGALAKYCEDDEEFKLLHLLTKWVPEAKFDRYPDADFLNQRSRQGMDT